MNYFCKFCNTPIAINEDWYTGSVWVKCENIKCEKYNQVFTYVNKDDYERKPSNDPNIKDKT
jgi:hypothetical protein